MFITKARKKEILLMTKTHYRYFDKDLMLTVKIPEGWTTNVSDQFPLIIFAPSEAGYQANLGFDIIRLNPPTLQNIINLFKESEKEQRAAMEHYELTRSGKISIDECDGYTHIHTWFDPEVKLHFSQVQAGVLINARLPEMLSVSGSCLKQFEAKYLPLLEDMINSIQFIHRA